MHYKPPMVHLHTHNRHYSAVSVETLPPLVSGFRMEWCAVAARLAHLLSCSGVPALFIHPADSLHGTSGAIRAEDTIIAISKGGETTEVVKFAAIAKERGAKLIAFTEKPASTLGRMADAAVHVEVAEDADPFGMVATTSSLANAVVGDAFCTLLLKLKGYTIEQFGRTHPGGAVGRKLQDMGLGGVK